MPNEGMYPVDPMMAFYAAVTAVENGSVGEIELEFRTALSDSEVVTTISVRKNARPVLMMPTNSKGE